MHEVPHDSKVARSPPVADASGSPTVGVNSHMLASPPRIPKNHHGKASFPWSPCSPALRSPKIQVARAGVILMALTAEMSIDTEMVRANCLKNAPVMPPRKALG